MDDCHSLPNTEFSPKQNAVFHAPDQVVDAAVGSASGAKYRLMSPAKLPISRSTCIIIPPGLSPTAFLDSPVLLSDIKVEPSPTTGSLFKPQVMQGSGQNTAVPLENSCPSSKDVNSESSSSFEFRFHTGASFNSRYESTGLSIPAGMTKRGLSSNQDQSYSHPSSSSSQAAPAGDDATICRSTVADEFSQEGALSRGIQASPSDRKDGISLAGVDRTSDDGYNWRKYGQKLVKGSEFPRSYYKCTFPNCEVKKIFERSPSGHITEIVYKGSHDHPKPQAARRHNSSVALLAHEDKMNKELLLPGHEDKSNTSNVEQNGSPVVSPLQANDEVLDSAGPQVPVSTADAEEDDPFTKRRKLEDCMDVTPVVKPIREPRVVVQTVSEVDILDDGYRWRKYGQKVVRGNPNPRSYYKCTNSGCPVRKHVERASHDPKAVITTYEGKHNHDVPTAKGSSHDFPRTAQPPYVGASKVRPQDSAPISLDLGVGINQNRPNEPVRGAMEFDSTLSAVHTTQDPGCYGIVANPYGIQENFIDGHGFQTPSVHPSNQFPPLQAVGRILMEPSTNPSI